VFVVFPAVSVIKSAEGASTWTQSSKFDFMSGEMKNLTIYGNEPDAAELRLMNNSQKWTKMPTINAIPSKHYSNTAPIWGEDKILYFGGGIYKPRTYYNETWVYDLSENRWTIKNTTQNPDVLGRKMVSVYGTDRVLLFGGEWNIDTDMWIYDLSENSWREISPSYRPNMDMFSEVTGFWGTDKILFFGRSATGDGETWIFHLSDETWTRKTGIMTPIARQSPGLAAVWGTDKVVLFGGFGYNTYDEYTWVYDLSENIWTKMAPISNPNVLSGQKMESIYGTDKTIFFDEYHTDIEYPEPPPPTPPRVDPTWIYDYGDDYWERVWPAGEPKHMYGRNVWGTDILVNFGGPRDTSETWLFDIFDFKENGVYTSLPYNVVQSSHFSKLKWTGETPLDSSIKFQLRTAETYQELVLEPFVGPDGRTDTYYTTKESGIWPGHSGDQWIQYTVLMNAGPYSDTPSLKEVSIVYNQVSSTFNVAPLEDATLVNNMPVFVWEYVDTEPGPQTAFQVVIDDNPAFKSIDYDSTIQFRSDDRWAFPYGTSYFQMKDGTWYWKVRTCDSDGSWGAFSAATSFTLDTAPPQSAPTVPKNSAFYNNLTTIEGVALDKEPGTGIENVELQIIRVNDGYYWNGTDWFPLSVWLAASGTETWTYRSSSVGWETGQVYRVRSKAVDSAGNYEFPSVGNSFTFDSETIKHVSISINKNAEYTNHRNVTVYIKVNESEKEIVKMALSTDGTYWTEWEPFAREKELELPAGDGEKFVYLKVRDLANNVGGAVYDSIILDTTPPGNLSILINNGASCTIKRNVVLKLSAYDMLSGVHTMSFSNDLQSWTPWQNFKTEINYELPSGNGTKKIYFRVKDWAKNVAEPVLATIELKNSTLSPLSLIDNDQFLTVDNNIPSMSDPDSANSQPGPSSIGTGKSGSQSIELNTFYTYRTPIIILLIICIITVVFYFSLISRERNHRRWFEEKSEEFINRFNRLLNNNKNIPPPPPPGNTGRKKSFAHPEKVFIIMDDELTGPTPPKRRSYSDSISDVESWDDEDRVEWADDIEWFDDENEVDWKINWI